MIFLLHLYTGMAVSWPNANAMKEKRWENIYFPKKRDPGADSPQHGYFPPGGMLVSFCSFKSEHEHTRRQSWVAGKCPGRQLGKSRFMLSSRTKLVVEPAPSSIKQTSVLRKSGAGIVQEQFPQSSFKKRQLFLELNCMCVYIFFFLYAYLHLFVNINIYLCTYIYVQICLYLFIYVHVYIQACTHIHLQK